MNNRLHAALTQLGLKCAVRKERRRILALAAAGAFLLFSFWNSFQDSRLNSDLANARVEETIRAGRIHIPHSDADFSAVILVEVDVQGRLKNIQGIPHEHGILDNLTVTPMKINNVAQPAKVPLTIPLDEAQNQVEVNGKPE